MKELTLLLLLSLVVAVSPAVTSPINALGTTLPSLTSNLNYRAFNDLMKQSLPLVPYRFIWGSVGRYWGYNLDYINGLTHMYPASLPATVYAVAEIQFYAEDRALVNKTFNVKFQGSGTIGVFQQNLSNLTWSTAAGGSFVLKAVNQSLFVYIYLTNTSNPVNSITIVEASLGNNHPTFTANFVNILQPFNLIRTCFWQGQSVYNPGNTR